MTSATSIDDLVDEAYAQRRRAWLAALVTAQNFLETIADEILDNVDRDRLTAQTARLKDPVRAADKIKRKVSEGRIPEPKTIDDVVDALGDLIGIKVLCKSPRDQHAFVDALERACRDPECSVRFAKDPMDYAAIGRITLYCWFGSRRIRAISTSRSRFRSRPGCRMRGVS